MHSDSLALRRIRPNPVPGVPVRDGGGGDCSREMLYPFRWNRRYCLVRRRGRTTRASPLPRLHAFIPLGQYPRSPQGRSEEGSGSGGSANEGGAGGGGWGQPGQVAAPTPGSSTAAMLPRP